MNKYFEELNVDFENKIIFLDVDGTLSADSDFVFEDAVLNQLNKIKEKNEIYLCSNCGDPNRKRRAAEILEIKAIANGKKKPSKSLVADLNLKGENCVVIGDKFLTDGLFARNIGARFIMVKKKISGKERHIIKIIYLIDDLIYKLYIKIVNFLKI